MIETLSPLVQVNGRNIRLTNLDKVLWQSADGSGWTKKDYLQYLQRVSDTMLPYYEARPLVVTRYPHGAGQKGFYQKNRPIGTPEWIPVFPYISPKTGDKTNFLVLDDRATLIWLGNSAAIELHPWLSTVDRPHCPDRMVIDLDPAEGATFDDVVQVAKLVRKLLEQLNWPGFLKTSGATGLHVFIPVQPRWDYGRIAELARQLGLLVRELMPDRVTLERMVAKRRGKVYFDYLQNGLGKTLVGPYSVRPLFDAPVSCPVHWDELGTFHPSDFRMDTVPERLARVGDPFRPLLDRRLSVDLSAAMKQFGIS